MKKRKNFEKRDQGQEALMPGSQETSEGTANTREQKRGKTREKKKKKKKKKRCRKHSFLLVLVKCSCRAKHHITEKKNLMVHVAWSQMIR
jgi:hypothetical protein